MPAPSPSSIAEDDLCPICHLLLYHPVKTTCSHVLCQSCMLQWAEASATSHSVPISPSSALDLDLSYFDPTFDAYTPSRIEANCPMCRTATTARRDRSLAKELEEKHPEMYKERRTEEEALSKGEKGEGVEGMQILIGNTHQLVNAGTDTPTNSHEWTFFLRFSRPEIVEGVAVHLHPTFKPRIITLIDPPFEVRRRGWGIFTIEARIFLNEEYYFVDRGKRLEHLEQQWTLDFTGNGSQSRVRAKVKKLNTGVMRPPPLPEGRARRRRASSPEDNRPSPTRWPHLDDDDYDDDEDDEDDED
ncbi:hypothetical protein BCR34DRAFT_625008 [Clohesyomyces aquaticus]|uniref:Uncharacterized protein n=1 Tax=Clohesyomyces aquaticus TaxID=1231657 RepID=A0A1Y1ZLK8_9PLEO|nr:hypothetical protein BCR34DRAFT_625008 [Clohesyomyces aquaticus]